MERRCNYFLLLLWCSYLLLSGVFLFTRGFLLNREVLPHTAKCKQSSVICDNTSDSNNNFHSSLQRNYDENFITELRQCSQEELLTEQNDSTEKQLTCWLSRMKVVLIVIDALKFDFVYFDEKLKDQELLPHQNKLTVINDLLTNEPNHTRLFKFIADPPTTTMQRLKGLTTGSLPTFIDVGSNFATPEINEDNLLDQIKAQNKNIVFMGDDTWSGLYPKRFIREYSYPSFNVWDLDTVDSGIMNHLLSEIVKKDWSLLVAHFLGVDHCGHRYGPYHSEMARKLNEMNDMIRSVVDTIDDNTMLFVIGDHGMTNTGDHGGDSDAEVTAAMFVLSPKPLLATEMLPNSDTVNQVDLVPTLAIILGLPIPFANLGTIILEALPSLSEGNDILSDWKFALKMLWQNVQQTTEYVKQYTKKTNQFSQEKLSLLQMKYAMLVENIKFLVSLEDFIDISWHMKSYLSLVRQMCEEVWVQFDAALMYNGLLLMFVSVFFIFLLVDGIPHDKFSEIFSGTFLYIVFGGLMFTAFGTLICYLINLVDNVEISLYISTGVLSMLMVAVVIIRSWIAISVHWQSQIKLIDWPDITGRLLFLLSLCGLFSNSYIVEEPRVLSYLLLTMAWFLVHHFKPLKPEPVGRVKSSEKQAMSWYNKSVLTGLKFKLFMFVTTLSVLVRLSQYYWLCREEQIGCESLAMRKAHSFANFLTMRYCNTQYFFTLISLALFITIARIWLRSCGNLVGFSLTVTLARYGPTIIVVCMGGFWVLHSLPKDTKSKLFLPWQIQFLPWIIYAVVFVALVTAFVRPLSIFVVPRKKESITIPVYGQTNVIPHLFTQIKELMRGRSKSGVSAGDDNVGKELPVVYGLATVYSSVFVNIAVFVCLLVALLLGDALAPSVVLMCSTATVLLTILSAIQYEKALHSAQLFNVPWSSVVCWGFLAVCFFYGTGHTPTFPGIQWEAAFVGTGGQFSNHIVPALLICINTFASHIVMSLMLPVLLVAPFTLHVMFSKILPSAAKDGVKSKDIKQGELVLYKKDDLLYEGAFILCARYILFFGIRMFACMLAATIHCRHLMVWKIFAPKLIFEGLGLFVVLICVLLSYLLMIRVTTQVERLLQRLEQENR